MSKNKLQSCVKKCKQLKSLKSVLNLAKTEKIKSAVSKLKSATSFTKKLSQTASQIKKANKLEQSMSSRKAFKDALAQSKITNFMKRSQVSLEKSKIEQVIEEIEPGEGSALNASSEKSKNGKTKPRKSIPGSLMIAKTARDSELLSLGSTLKDPFENSQISSKNSVSARKQHGKFD